MVQQFVQKQDEQIRHDPSVPQRFAADPGASAWVSASAGTGKTKVLTDRVLRLLLPRADGAKGTAPHKILCLTFTKAAASEMALRIGRTLGEWAVMPEDRLATKLATMAAWPICPGKRCSPTYWMSCITCSGSLTKARCSACRDEL